MTVFLLLAATAGLLVSLGDPRKILTRADLPVLAWAFGVVVWPISSIFLAAPLLWASPDQAGSLFPVLQYFPGLVVSGGMVLAAFRAGERTEISVPAMIVGVPMFFSLAWLVIDDPGTIPQIGVGAILFLGVLPKTRRTGIRVLGWVSAASLTLITASTLLAAVVNSDLVLAGCRLDKCGLASQVITSPFAGNGNILGLAVVLLVPLSFATIHGWRVVPFLGGTVAIVVLADGRTAMLGLAVVLAIFAALVVFRDPEFRRILAIAGIAGAALMSALPFFLQLTNASFSFRAEVWRIAGKMISQNPLFGHGPGYWQRVGQSALADVNYSPHNGWMDVTVSIGVVGLAFLLVGTGYQLLSTRPEDFRYLAGYYAGILALSTLESVYVPYYLGTLPFAALLPLMFYDQRPAKNVESAEIVESAEVEGTAPTSRR